VSPGKRALLCALGVAALALFTSGVARAQGTRPARFAWEPKKTQLFVDVEFRDVIDSSIKKKLTRGLPTTIVFTGALYVQGNPAAVATTAQTCKVTWLVWDEVYQIEISRPSGTSTVAALDVKGVLKRCAVAKRLLVATSAQLTPGAKVYLNAKVQVNPVSAAVFDKIKKWVSRPTGTGTAAPGDALFSTFTGLFLQRIGDAESELKFSTRTLVPAVEKKK
jgi:hypothetical protein